MPGRASESGSDIRLFFALVYYFAHGSRANLCRGLSHTLAGGVLSDGRHAMKSPEEKISRREFAEITTGAASLCLVAASGEAAEPNHATFEITINGKQHSFELEPRVTLLDLLRERSGLTGTKKGCDHGQCGACTVLADGRRINSCLALAITQQGKEIVTIEGLGSPAHLHAMQAAFIEEDGFQCGFCTAGQICSGIAMLSEYEAGMPSTVSFPVKGKPPLSDDEIRERMAGNICRCGAYPNIIAAIRSVHDPRARESKA
jgi:xanthine dehydrogenase YagT iron-sulfur-binding subunit